MYRNQILSVAALSAATLLFESTLIRLLAVTQFYHFAFLIISLALLGFGASGTLLSLFPRLQEIPLDRMIPSLGLGFLLSVGMAYIVVNLLPFDSYSIAWDRRQVLLFALYYLVLTFPFIISGLGIGSAIAKGQQKSHIYYASNLLGSGIGALLAPAALHLAGVPGAIVLSCILGLTVSLIAIQEDSQQEGKQKLYSRLLIYLSLGGMSLFILLTILNLQSRAPLGMNLSPYKGLAQAQRVPTSKILFKRWNAVSRLDVVANGGTHQMPGLSYLYPGLLPEQFGLSLDGDTLAAVTLTQPEDFDAAAYLPESIIFKVVPDAKVLVLEPGGGLGVLQAVAGGATDVTTVVDNVLIPHAINSVSPDVNIFMHRNVRTIYENDRIYLAREDNQFDIIFVPLTDSYKPVSSGAYSLVENYSLTVEAFKAILTRLKPDGLFVFTRWIQIPPSESIRAIALILEALEQSYDLPIQDQLVVYRGIQTITVIVRPAGWPPAISSMIRKFTEERKYDLVWMPDIQQQEVNRFNRLPKASFYSTVRELLYTQDRFSFYEIYPYDVSPPTDDSPFFFHFFTWEQTSDVLASLGHTWLPFGGSGYFVLFALLLLTVILSIGLILIPFIFHRGTQSRNQKGRWYVVLYFGLLGIGFLFIEIPLIQRWILLLGHPIYAFTIVVAILLIFSGIGSSLARAVWLPRRAAFGLLVLLVLFLPFTISFFSTLALNLPLWGRLGATILCLAPLGILMGMPFPLGVIWLEGYQRTWIPIAWAVNGCASVIASVLAAILSLSNGFTFVMFFGAAAYVGAAALYTRMKTDQ